MTTFTIAVTAAHIAAGIRNSCESCPLALAVADAVPATKVGIGKRGNWIRRGPIWRDFKLPDAARDFIRAFDRGEPVEPFTFEIAINF